jgi:hypothetical protein
MGEAVQLYEVAARCFARVGGAQGGRLVLSLFFKAILGVQRIFHFGTVKDTGLAWLTGGPRVLSRSTLGEWVRAVPARSVGRFIYLTQPLLDAARQLCVSIDEHAVARFTRKFLIPKGFHTIRNKKMRVEKLFYAFDTGFRTLLDVVVTPGSARLARIAKEMLATLRRKIPRGQLRVVLDAGAAQSHRELLELADDNKGHVLLVRTPRRPAYRRHWQSLPEASFARYEEPGRYTGAPPKPIHVTETTTRMRANKESPFREIRTIVVREEKRSGKDRWHALFVFGDDSADALSLVKEFRARQHHEQTYRVLLHDAFVDAAPSGYNKRSRNPNRPGFRKNALGLYAWVTGLAVNALKTFTHSLPERFHFAHPRTLRRFWLNVDAELYLSQDALIVLLRPCWFRDWWAEQIRHFNDKRLRVPWLGNRRVLLSLAGLPPSNGNRQPIRPEG